MVQPSLDTSLKLMAEKYITEQSITIRITKQPLELTQLKPTLKLTRVQPQKF
jgi:hypothetical protein